MYSIKLHGVAGPEPDIVKVRVYVNGGTPTDATAAPGAAFDVIVTTAVSGVAVVEHAFIDSSGAESVRYQQSITVPDLQPPAKPTTALTIVSITWS